MSRLMFCLVLLFFLHSNTSMRAIGVFLVLCFVLEVFILENIMEPMILTSVQESKPANRKLKSGMKGGRKSIPHRHVIINSYMRSGSSFFGELLGFRPDTFYWFELFWRFTKWGFIKEQSTVCDSRTCQSCFQAKYASRAQVTQVLRDLFHCNFSNMTSVLERMSAYHSGSLWKTSGCKTNPFNAKQCLMSVENHCKAKQHSVTKILRTTVDMYHDFLGESEDIVLIQLFRDPRAVVNSRHRTGWYTSMYKDYQSMTEDVQCLCSRMYADYKYGLEYQENYPGKFMFVVYEDLLSDLPKKLDQLYRKLGMDTLDELSNSSGEFQKLVGLHKTNKTENRTKRKDYEFWWRSSLTWATVQTIDRSCRDIYQAIGYKSFTNEKQFRNYAIPSVELKDGLKI